MRQGKRDQHDGIHQRTGSAFWWATVTIDGKSTRRSTGIRISDDPNKRVAQSVRQAWLSQPAVPVLNETIPTFDDLMMQYLAQVTPTKRAPERDRFSVKALFPFFTGRELRTIGAADVRGYIASRLSAEIQPGTVNKEVGLMSAAVNWAQRELGWAIENHWATRRQREPAGRDRWLTPDEAMALLTAAASRRDRYPWIEDFIQLGLASGLRPGEMLQLTWSRVSLTDNMISFAPRDQKSGKRERLPFGQQARAALIRRASFRATHCPDSEWVFCRRDGSRILSVKRGFAGCVADAGLSDVHPHDLRRTFGSWLVQSGVGIERVSKLLRHADVAITARVYAHLRPGDLASAVCVVDAQISHNFTDVKLLDVSDAADVA